MAFVLYTWLPGNTSVALSWCESITCLSKRQLQNLFLDFDFEAGEMCLDASQDTDASVNLTY